MDYSKYVPFRAEGKSLEIVEDFWNQRQAMAEEQKTLIAEVGAETAIHQCGCIIGFVFDGDPPEGWKKRGSIQGRNYFAPERRKKADKAIHRKINDSRMPGHHELHKMFTGHSFGEICEETTQGVGMVIRYITYEIIGDDVILLSPKPNDGEAFEPPDSVRLKMSEFWTLKEAA